MLRGPLHSAEWESIFVWAPLDAGAFKESTMTTKRKSKPALQAVESARMRSTRIVGSQNGATLRTRVVKDRTKYNRNLKHKKSLADAGDFPVIAHFPARILIVM